MLSVWSDAAGSLDFDRDDNMNLSPNDKIAGVLAPLFALRTEDDLGIGDLDALRQFIDWARGIGFKLVQLLPINEIRRRQQPLQRDQFAARSSRPRCTWLPGRRRTCRRKTFEEVIAGIDLPALRRGAVKYRIVKPLKKKLLGERLRRFPRTCRKSIRRSRQRSPHFAKRKNPGLTITPSFEC